MPAADTAPTSPRLDSSAGPLVPAMATPVAVVWCRQVDNEAESPGYTTVPEEFPGLRETLDVIRIVGNLTVNVADTHDYWDPDPSQPLSYYPNIFLYPAYGGRYTCLGRMFLSTEDRPRLGMKTLVLDTQQLLQSGDFGGTILRWHASMGGARSDGGRPAPVPDPKLYDLVGEAFLFHKGSTEPLVVVASDEWESAMQVILDLVRSLPASLAALGAILAFPYFLPQPKTNLHEFTEQLPLALALMRVPRGEAVGDRHEKRMSSWESAPVTLRDVTAGLPSSGRGKDPTPLVLQHVRDHNRAKLAPVVQRVDLVELPRVRGHLADPERQAGRDRRKEMWRIGTAMESAALLLQRARGRHVPVNVETAKRAQEYLQARLPEPKDAAVPDEPVEVAVHPPSDIPSPSQHPPWLQTAAVPAVPAPSKGPESVPVSVSEDPSLLVPPARPAPPPLIPPGAAGAVSVSRPAGPTPPKTPPPQVPAVAPASPPARPGPTVAAETPRPNASTPAAPPPAAPRPASPTVPPPPAAPPLDVVALKQAIGAELLRLVDERMAAIQTARNPPPPPPGLDAVAQQQVDERMKFLRDQLSAEVARQATQVQERVGREQAALEARQRELLDARVSEGIESRWSEMIEPRLAEVRRRADVTAQAQAEQLQGRLKSDVDQLGAELRASVGSVEESLRATLTSQVDLGVAQVGERERQMQTTLASDLAAQVDQRLAELEARRAKELRELEQKVILLLEARQRDIEEKQLPRVQSDLDRVKVEASGRLKELDQRFLDLEARRVKELRDLEQKVTALLDARQRDLQEKQLPRLQTDLERLKGEAEGRIKEFDLRLRSTAEQVRSDLQDAQVKGMADLQVRLQAYTDQKLKEDVERERQKYLELLARLRSEIDQSVGRLLDTSRFDAAVRERVDRALEAQRSDFDRRIATHLSDAQGRAKVETSETLERLQRIEELIERRHGELRTLEEAVRTELDDLDRRSQILADRLVPVVRKTWQRIADLEKARPPGGRGDEVERAKQEVDREVRRLATEVDDRFAELRERMETSISNQGRVWLTLIRQLSQLTEDRRAIEAGRAALRRAGVPETGDEATSLEALPSLLQSRSREAADDEESDADLSDRPRRRRRSFSR